MQKHAEFDEGVLGNFHLEFLKVKRSIKIDCREIDFAG